MNAAATDLAPISAIYQPPMCPQCAYSLAGLPAEFKCPECGLEYDRDHVFVYGWTGGWWNNPRGSRSILASPVFLVFLLQAIIQLIVFAELLPRSLHAFPAHMFTFTGLEHLFVLLITFSALAVIIYRHRKYRRTMPAPVQLRLTPAGFTAREGTGNPPRWNSWDKVTNFLFDPARKGPPRFGFRGPGPIWLNIELDLTPQQAAAIARRIHQFMSSVNHQLQAAPTS